MSKNVYYSPLLHMFAISNNTYFVQNNAHTFIYIYSMYVDFMFVILNFEYGPSCIFSVYFLHFKYMSMQ